MMKTLRPGEHAAALLALVALLVSPIVATSASAEPARFMIAGDVTGETPTIEGDLGVGEELTAVEGEWGPDGVDFGYRWLRDSVMIPSQEDNTYTLAQDDAGTVITVEVTGSLDDYTPLTLTSAPGDIVTGGTLTPGTVTIGGTAKVGATLTALEATWSPEATFGYVWSRGATIVGDEQTYDVTPADNGAVITVTVTGTRSGFTSLPVTSTGVTIGAGALTQTPTPTITGKLTAGSTLSVNRGTWAPAPVSFTYQWLKGGAKIAGAKASTYKVKTTDVGARISVTVTGSRTGFAPVAKTSAAQKILKTFAKTTPTISGTAKLGQTLTALTKAVSPKPTKVSYQWKRDGAAIAKATKSSYKLVGADGGKKISVTVVVSKSGYADASGTSAKTKAVVMPAPPKNTTKKQKVEAGTYATNNTEFCLWARLSGGKKSQGLEDVDGDDVIGFAYGAGQRIVTVKASDKWFQAEGCGSWKNVSKLKAVSKTAADGEYMVGEQLKPGLWETTGPVDPEYPYCYVAAHSGFGGTAEEILYDTYYEEAGQFRIFATDAGFETSGCKWTRISD